MSEKTVLLSSVFAQNRIFLVGICVKAFTTIAVSAKKPYSPLLSCVVIFLRT